jgi:hypothetical protein
MPFPPHPPWLDSSSSYLAKNTIYEAPHYAVFSIPPVTSSTFSPNILNTLSLCTSLNVRDNVSHPYKTTCKFIVLYVLIFMFFNSRQKDESFWTEWQQALPEFRLLVTTSWIRFCLLLSFPNIWTVQYFQRIYLLSLCYDFTLHSGDKTSSYSLFLCFYFWTNLLTSIRVSVFWHV